MDNSYYYVVQAPDVTEITCCGLESVLTEEALRMLVPTEFAWVTTSPRTHKRGLDALARLGFKHLTSMRNWYHGHDEEWRRMDFYWKRVKQQSIPMVRTNPRFWSGEYTPKLSSSGCGFAFDEPPILDAFNKFFTLVRMPLAEHHAKNHLVTLEKFNYRLVDVGSQSAFYINGWDPDKWSRETELKFFGGTGENEARKEVVTFESNTGRASQVAGLGAVGGVAIPAPIPNVPANNNIPRLRLRDEHGRFRTGGFKE
jgi:hypothetical protein